MNPIVNFSLHCYQICEINKNQLHGKRIVSGPVRFRLSIFCRGGCSSAVLFDDNHLWLILGWVRISAEMITGLGLGQGWVLRDKTLDAGIKNSHFSISWSPIFKWWCTASVSMYATLSCSALLGDLFWVYPYPFNPSQIRVKIQQQTKTQWQVSAPHKIELNDC